METKTEKILMKALGLLEDGKTEQEILGLFPDERAELHELFETINLLHSTKKEILPSKNFIANLINALSTTAPAPTPKITFKKLVISRILVPTAVFAALVALVLINTGLTPQTTLIPSQSDHFELSVIQSEAQAAEFNPELISFLEEENNIQEVDIVLTNL